MFFHALIRIGAQVFWLLMRRGFEESDVFRFIKNNFSIDEQRKVTNSTYHKRKKYAVLKTKTADRDIINTVLGNTKQFDMTRGLSKNERKLYAAKYGIHHQKTW